LNDPLLTKEGAINSNVLTQLDNSKLATANVPTKIQRIYLLMAPKKYCELVSLPSSNECVIQNNVFEKSS
jgi:hypothetical protein